MKYKCFCAKKFHDLTVDEIRNMRRSGAKRIEIEKFIDYYNISIDEYNERIKVLKGISLISEERNYWMKQQKKRKLADEEVEVKYIYTVESIPDSMIAAIYQVDFEIIKGKVHYDTESLNRARKDINRKIDMFDRVVEETKDTTAYSNLKGVDLKAMRIYRGKNKRTLSKLSRIKESELTMYENEKLKIPKYIEQIYKETLNVKDRHIFQLRDIMNGKSDKVEEDRSIPKLVKLRVFKRDKGKCTKCESKDKLHFHHIKHFADGGQNTPENLKLLCVSCHAEEHKGEKSYHMLKSMASEG
ncbi:MULTISPECIES: HNH endonuclease signature motif containing protein [unclassified Oceanobacillus]|uniref:HNH endonuclease n=1 Tax=unclassified Oceanobacillus TaxID=2630292 RepID=UPI001BED02AD|nr:MULTISPECIES: HNH endonuclease signature motif containing protein [unclassified Oceanobacillus]MBT2600961.1 HNH endonuclease [Oceanobacillus sp. ISL-74]MBT2653588.1 HNH endonuclease [Oceanobacillus sp. ISL-73]